MSGYGWHSGSDGYNHNHHRHNPNYITPTGPPIYGGNTNFGNPWVPPSYCQGSFEWVRGFEGAAPMDAVPAGTDVDGSPLFVGRAHHYGDMVPAKVSPSHRCAYICYDGSEVPKHEYEVLVTRHAAWKYARGGDVPHQAIRVGHTREGEPLYTGRTMHNGALTPGKIHPSHGSLYIPYDGREVKFTEYEVLILV